MIDLLRSIVDSLSAVFNLVINIMLSLVNFAAHIPTYTDFLFTSIGFLPSIILPFAIASVSLYVVMLLLNRQGG